MYHSALSGNKIVEYVEPCTRFEVDSSIAFVHDICNGIPDEYSACDIMYSEPSWMHGYEVFSARAGGAGSYSDYVNKINEIIGIGTPTVLLLGKKVMKKLKQSDSQADNIKCHGFVGTMFAWNTDISNLSNCKLGEFYNALSKRYNCIGDFSCGYGNSGIAFYNAGKRFIMSDINANCIGVIRDRIHGKI